jgi:hypothetical protein
MKNLKNSLLIICLSWMFVACSDGNYVNLDEVMVPVTTPDENLEGQGESQASLDTEEVREPATVEPVVDSSTPMTSLRSAILANSDVSEKALDNAFTYFNKNQNIIRNKNYMVIFDIGQHSGKKRFYMINLKTGAVTAMHSAHGSGSDTDHDGYAEKFSNVSGSHMSSLGFMLTAEEYVGKHGGSMRLDGQESRNSKVRSRAIVVHGANYVNPALSKMGRSQGCPAVADSNIKEVVAKTKNGSLFYIFNSKYD